MKHDADNSRSLGLNLGLRIRHARRLRGLTLKQLSGMLGVSESYVSKIENDRISISVPFLHRIASELGVNVNFLFSDKQHDENAVFVLRADERPTLSSSSKTGGKVVLEGLIPAAREFILQANIHNVYPGGHVGEFITHVGQEFGFVLEGNLELYIDDNYISVSAGDIFCFDSELKHKYRNVSNEVARVLWVNTPPTF